MKLKKVTVILFVLAFQSVYGQSGDNSNRNQFFDPLKNKNHWGINTQFALDKLFETRTTPIEIIYKRQKTENKANRLGLQFYYDHDNERPYPIANKDWNTIETDLIAGIFFGKEKQHFIGNSNRWQWYYGTDLNLTFTYNKRYIDDGDDSDLREYDDARYYKYSAAIKPFVGMRFEITPHIYVSTDMLVNAQYAYQEIHVELKNSPDTAIDFFRYSSTQQFWDTKFYPFTRLSLFIKL
jgi:hypothetical protein